MTKDIMISIKEQEKVSLVREYAKDWASKHQVAIGVAEIALGAAAITWGINTGAIEYGKDIVATLSGDAGRITGLASAGVGGFLGSMLGSIGVVACGGAIGIPAALVIGGAAWVFGASGYTIGSELSRFLNPIDYGAFFKGVSVLSIGLALVVDGLRRITPDWLADKARGLMCDFSNGVIRLGKCVGKAIVKTKREFDKLVRWVYQNTNYAAKITVGTTAIAGATAGGVAAGSAIAASSVTLLGSHTLGSAALSLGLVSAPVLPVVLCGVGAFVLAGGVMYSLKKIGSKKEDDEVLIMNAEDLEVLKAQLLLE